MINALVQKIPEDLLKKSGKVFYSGKEAFADESSLYVLGVNPGGRPENYQRENVITHTLSVLQAMPENWSAYRDESWEGQPPGTYGMAPRVLHLFNCLGVNPGRVPCSNLVFERSRNENDVANRFKTLADLCWPFHQYVIDHLRPKVILCFGKTAGNYVRKKLHANLIVNKFVENNDRKWKSQTYVNRLGMKVIVATHPSRANWCNPDSDPARLVRDALNNA